MSKTIFGSYSKYYNLLYKDKDYKSEADYVKELIRTFKSDVSSVFDLGCGTGFHAEMISRDGYIVHGIDLSHSMIEQAKKNLLKSCTLKLGMYEITHVIKNLML